MDTSSVLEHGTSGYVRIIEEYGSEQVAQAKQLDITPQLTMHFDGFPGHVLLIYWKLYAFMFLNFGLHLDYCGT